VAKKPLLPFPVPEELRSMTLGEILAYFENRYGHDVGRGRKPALVIVDFSVPFTKGMLGFPSDGYEPAVAKTVELLAAARRARLPVFFTTLAYEPHMRDAGHWAAKVPWISALQCGSAASEIDERLAPEAGETVINKKYPSAFFDTDLEARLNKDDVDTVVLAGCTSSACVRATAIDSMQRGFKTVIGADAVGDLIPAVHWIHLTDLASRYVDVAAVSELIDYFETCRKVAA